MILYAYPVSLQRCVVLCRRLGFNFSCVWGYLAKATTFATLSHFANIDMIDDDSFTAVCTVKC